MPWDTFRELQLPTKPMTDENPTFRLGITSATTVTPAAYLSSVPLTLPFVRTMSKSFCKMAFNEQFVANKAHRMLKICKIRGEAPEMSEFEKGPSTPPRNPI